jgi:periplasmic divalent cation tolerance protein
MVSRGTIIMSTFPSEESVADVANTVMGKKLCACANFTKIRSIYTWRGKVQDEHEFIALFKTTAKSAKKLKTEIIRLHPYEVPEIFELKMVDGSKSYLSWLIESTDGVAKKRYNSAKR